MAWFKSHQEALTAGNGSGTFWCFILYFSQELFPGSLIVPQVFRTVVFSCKLSFCSPHFLLDVTLLHGTRRVMAVVIINHRLVIINHSPYFAGRKDRRGGAFYDLLQVGAAIHVISGSSCASLACQGNLFSWSCTSSFILEILVSYFLFMLKYFFL